MQNSFAITWRRWGSKNSPWCSAIGTSITSPAIPCSPIAHIIATSLTRDALIRHKADIEAGKVWGPPAIAPLIFPNIMFDDHMELRVGEIALDLRRMNIHSIDGCVAYLPKDKLLLAGDTLEDPLTYMIEVENLAEHLRNLREMQGWDIARILPNHGDPDVIMSGRIRQDPDRRDHGLCHEDALQGP